MLIEERHHSRSHSLSLILWDVDELWQPDVCVCVLCTHARVTEQSLNVASNLSLALCVGLCFQFCNLFISLVPTSFSFLSDVSLFSPSITSISMVSFLSSLLQPLGNSLVVCKVEIPKSSKSPCFRNCKGIFWNSNVGDGAAA